VIASFEVDGRKIDNGPKIFALPGIVLAMALLALASAVSSLLPSAFCLSAQPGSPVLVPFAPSRFKALELRWKQNTEGHKGHGE
jgi:hypothetical protein